MTNFGHFCAAPPFVWGIRAAGGMQEPSQRIAAWLLAITVASMAVARCS